MTCTGPTPFKPLLIRVPSEQTLDDFNISASFRTGSYLKLPIQPQEYSKIVEGDVSRLSSTFSRTVFSPRLARVGFRITSGITEYNVYACLEYVAKISASTSYSEYTAIQVIDYVRPETEDLRAVINSSSPVVQAATTRYGAINMDGSGGGSYGFDNKTATETGLVFTFSEATKRLIV